MKTYTIWKGNHYNTRWWEKVTSLFSLWGKTSVSFKVIFDDSCFDDSPVTGINKVGGISWGLNGDHKNSVRLGWDTSKNIYAYIYAKGEGPKWVRIGAVEAGEEYTVTCAFYMVGVDGLGSIAVAVKPSIFAFRCFPYFGGKEVAPRDVKMELEWFK